MPVTLRLDRFHFPVVSTDRLPFGVGLFPVTRVQFEYLLGTPRSWPRSSYEEIEACSPRASWRAIPAQNPERVFWTGVQPEEAERFASWAGSGCRLPTEAEWRQIDQVLGEMAVNPARLLELADRPQLHPAARALLRWVAGRPRVSTWRSVMLLEDGLLEWVRCSQGRYGLHGRPSPYLFQIVHNPLVHPAIMPLRTNRNRAFGFRLVY